MFSWLSVCLSRGLEPKLEMKWLEKVYFYYLLVTNVRVFTPVSWQGREVTDDVVVCGVSGHNVFTYVAIQVIDISFLSD